VKESTFTHRRLGSGVVLAGALIMLALAVAPSAIASLTSQRAVDPARSGYTIKGLQDSITLSGSNGYAIGVTGQPVKGSSASVSLTASNPHGNATYLADSGSTATVTAKAVKASFDQFGKVNVKFHAKRTKMAKPPKGCTGKKAKEKVGTFKGTIKFKGEGNYTSVNAKSAKGTVVSPKWHCHNGATKPATILDAYQPTQIGPAPLQFTAIKRNSSSKASFLASTFEYKFGSGGSVGITRGVFVNAPASSTFSFNPGLTSANVNPPAPFSGSAQFASGKWTGSLKASFPGRSNVGLTGSDWKASLTHGSG